MPVLLDARLARLPHLPGPEPRVAELLDQRRDVLRRRPSDRQRSPSQSEKSLIRCAAHSARISEPGMPQTFSVYERKKMS